MKIGEEIEKALPRIREKFGEVTIRDVVKTIGAKELLRQCESECMRLSASSIRGEYSQQTPWMDVVGLYSRAIQERENPPYLGEGI
jgi:hypothetical protein